MRKEMILNKKIVNFFQENFGSDICRVTRLRFSWDPFVQVPIT